jgi:hypothetical protein
MCWLIVAATLPVEVDWVIDDDKEIQVSVVEVDRIADGDKDIQVLVDWCRYSPC